MSIHPYCSSFAGALALIAPPIAFGQTPPADANQAPTAFSENFAAPTTSWKIFPADAAGKDWLQWQPASSGRPGWGFVTQGRMGAMREWAVGTRPFVFDFEIEMDKGKSESWRQNGASVSISSAPLTSPETTDRVLVLAIGVMQSGIQASVKLGPFADFQSSSDSQAPTPDAKVKEAKRYVEAGAAPLPAAVVAARTATVGACEVAYDEMAGMVEDLERKLGPGTKTEGKMPPKDKFLSGCKALPPALQSCLVLSYAMEHQEACVAAKSKLDPATAGKVGELMKGG